MPAVGQFGVHRRRDNLCANPAKHQGVTIGLGGFQVDCGKGAGLSCLVLDDESRIAEVGGDIFDYGTGVIIAVTFWAVGDDKRNWFGRIRIGRKNWVRDTHAQQGDDKQFNEVGGAKHHFFLLES